MSFLLSPISIPILADLLHPGGRLSFARKVCPSPCVMGSLKSVAHRLSTIGSIYHITVLMYGMLLFSHQNHASREEEKKREEKEVYKKEKEKHLKYTPCDNNMNTGHRWSAKLGTKV